MAENLASDATPAAVLNAFHAYWLNSVTNSGLQSNGAFAATAAATRSRTPARERNGTRLTKTSGKLPQFFQVIIHTHTCIYRAEFNESVLLLSVFSGILCSVKQMLAKLITTPSC